MRKGRIPVWLMLMLAGVALLLVIPGLWVFVSITATPLYPNAKAVPSVAKAIASAQWADAVEQGRRIVRANVVEQNLPGLSLAAGIDGEIVWAEGFGFADLKTSAPVTPDHRFRIGTASTALTSAAAGLLLEDGRLKLDDEIQTYVPAFPKKQWPVTVRELMGPRWRRPTCSSAKTPAQPPSCLSVTAFAANSWHIMNIMLPKCDPQFCRLWARACLMHW